MCVDHRTNIIFSEKHVKIYINIYYKQESMNICLTLRKEHRRANKVMKNLKSQLITESSIQW
jgi:hypothetical protein